MTTPLSCWEIGRQIKENVPGSAVETDKDAVVIDSQHILAAATFLNLPLLPQLIITITSSLYIILYPSNTTTV